MNVVDAMKACEEAFQRCCLKTQRQLRTQSSLDPLSVMALSSLFHFRESLGRDVVDNVIRACEERRVDRLHHYVFTTAINELEINGFSTAPLKQWANSLAPYRSIRALYRDSQAPSHAICSRPSAPAQNHDMYDDYDDDCGPPASELME